MSDFALSLRHVGKKIQAARMEKQLTQEQLAQMVGCSLESLQKIETGNTDYAIDLLQHISVILEKQISYFFSEEDHETYEKRLACEVLYLMTLLSTETKTKMLTALQNNTVSHTFCILPS